MFSGRVPRDLQPNRLTQAVRDARRDGRLRFDLTGTNPTSAGIAYDATLLNALADPAALRYEPQPFGLEPAREAVAADYARRGMAVSPARIVLTASTSEAYSLLFKLLCDPDGAEVLVPVPSYPLFDHLTRLDGVAATSYQLDYHDHWTVDLAGLDEAWSPRTRAVLAVSPNNPTGSVMTGAEVAELSRRCAARDAALIVDEVFIDYPLRPGGGGDTPHVVPECLTFRLGGLSKSAGLPQVKLGWIAVDGPEALVADALDRLELICDTYLSVSTPVQIAAPTLIARGADVRQRIIERVRGNYGVMRELAAGHSSVDVLHADAGWSAVLRIPATRPEEETVLDLLDRAGVLVHPGYFFDFPFEAFLVVSLLAEPSQFREGLQRVLERTDV